MGDQAVVLDTDRNIDLIQFALQATSVPLVADAGGSDFPIDSISLVQDGVANGDYISLPPIAAIGQQFRFISDTSNANYWGIQADGAETINGVNAQYDANGGSILSFTGAASDPVYVDCLSVSTTGWLCQRFTDFVVQ